MSKHFNSAKKILTVILAVLTAVMCVTAASAEESSGSDFIKELENPGGRILGISWRGDSKNYPENTVEGVISAAETGIDAVLVDVAETKDGTLIIFGEETTASLTAETDVYTIADTDYATLSSLHLKNRSGGVYEDTDYTIPTLQTMLEKAKENGISLVLNVSCENLPAVSKMLGETGTDDSVAVMVKDSAKNIESAVNACETKPHLITVIRSNVIFAVTSFENKTEEIGGSAVCLKTTNRYGVNFYKSALSLLDGRLRACADLSDTGTAGHRSDTEKWWDDLISRGYSVIITTEPSLFMEYLERTSSKRELLQNALTDAQNYPVPEYGSKTFNDYRKAYDDAVADATALLEDGSSACRDLSDAYAALNKAVDDINRNYEALEEGTAGLNVTPVSIFLCIFAVALVVAAQLFVNRKHRTKK